MHSRTQSQGSKGGRRGREIQGTGVVMVINQINSFSSSSCDKVNNKKLRMTPLISEEGNLYLY